jgi:hypothetical protein
VIAQGFEHAEHLFEIDEPAAMDKLVLVNGLREFLRFGDSSVWLLVNWRRSKAGGTEGLE